jgi:hypothetical protein
VGLILLLVLAVFVVVLIALAVVAYTGQQKLDGQLPVGPDPSTIPIRPDFARCTVRASRARVLSQGWEEVRIAFYLSGARRPVRQFFFEHWSRDAMNGFEDRLVDLGFMRTAAGSSDELPKGFDRAQHFVIFTREKIRREP